MAETTAHGAAAAHGAAESASGMPQLEFGTFPNQIFWLVIALLATYYILSRLALPRLAGVLEDRHNTIAADLDKAAELKHRAVEAEAAYDKALAEARAEAQQIAASAREEMNREVEAATAKADAEISARASESEERIREIKANAMASVEGIAGDTAAEIVKALLPGASDADALNAAIKSRIGG